MPSNYFFFTLNNTVFSISNPFDLVLVCDRRRTSEVGPATPPWWGADKTEAARYSSCRGPLILFWARVTLIPLTSWQMKPSNLPDVSFWVRVRLFSSARGLQNPAKLLQLKKLYFIWPLKWNTNIPDIQLKCLPVQL